MNFKMRTFNFLVILVLIVLGCKNRINITKNDTNEVVFQSVLDSIYKKNKNCIGLMVHVEAPDKNISWSGVIGVSDTINKEKLQINQPVLIASNTKTYVAAAILILVEQNKIRLNDAIEDYITKKSQLVLEKGGYKINNIKLKHLLSHTSGIFDYAGTDEYFERIIKNPKHRWTRDEQIDLAITLGKPLGNVGEVFAYADTNYLLLTEIIETITKKVFYHLIVVTRDRLNYVGYLQMLLN